MQVPGFVPKGKLLQDLRRELSERTLSHEGAAGPDDGPDTQQVDELVDPVAVVCAAKQERRANTVG